MLHNPAKWLYANCSGSIFPNLNYLKPFLTDIVIPSQFEYLVVQKYNNGATKFGSLYSVTDTIFHITNQQKTSSQFAPL